MSTRQEYAIQLLLEGVKEAEIARRVGVRQAQVRAWKENPRFRQAWAQAGLKDNAWILGGLVGFERQRRRRPPRETRWTAEKEDANG